MPVFLHGRSASLSYTIFFFHRAKPKNLVDSKIMSKFAPHYKKTNDFVAQLVEQLTLNQWVEGSSPSEVTTRNGKTLRIKCSQRLFILL